MANQVRIKIDSDRFVTKLKKSLSQLMGRSVLESIGVYGKKRIVNTTRSGYSLASGEQKVKNKGLSERYISYRIKYQAFGGWVGELFSPRRSNLTLTGQLLSSVTYRVFPGLGKTEVYVPETNRKQPTRISNRKVKPEPQPTNAELARDLASRGRPFMGMDASGQRTIKNIILRDLRSQLRAARLKSKP